MPTHVGGVAQDLKDHFKQAGNVVYADMLRDGDRSKGCGIVEFSSPEEATGAISNLNETELHGRRVIVREDREEGKFRSRPAY